MINNEPLRGRRVVVTRNAEGNSRLKERLEALGAEVLSLPLINIRHEVDREKAEEIFAGFGGYEWLVFTSRNGVEHFFRELLDRFHDIRALGMVRIAALGPGTAEALFPYFLRPDLVPPEANADSLCEALGEEQTVDNLKILLITGNQNREDLEKGLWEARAIVDKLQVYRTETHDLSAAAEAAEFRGKGADALVFASSSAVRAFGEQAAHLQLEKDARVPALCSFGPQTSERMRGSGIPVHVEAANPGIDGMVTALVDWFAHKDDGEAR